MVIGFCFRQRHQLRHGLGRHRFVQHDGMRREVGEPDRDEILERIVAELGLHERVDGERAVRAGEQRVAVGRRGHLCGAEAAAGAGAVLDHDRSGRATATCPRPPRRPTRSALPPAANGTIRRIGGRIGREGRRGSSEANGAAASVVRSVRRDKGMAEVLNRGCCGQAIPARAARTSVFSRRSARRETDVLHTRSTRPPASLMFHRLYIQVSNPIAPRTGGPPCLHARSTSTPSCARPASTPAPGAIPAPGRT